MLSSDIHKLKQVLKKTRRSRQFQNQFAHIMHLNTKPAIHVTEEFDRKFPKLAYLKQMQPHDYSYSSVANSFATGGSNKSQLENEEPSIINKEDEQMFSDHYKNMKSMPTFEGNDEIRLIIECFKEVIEKHSSKKFYDELWSLYNRKGGKKDFGELKQKVQSDVLLLVERQVRKKKKT